MRQLTSLDGDELLRPPRLRIVADRDQMTNVQCLIEWLGDELEALKPA